MAARDPPHLTSGEFVQLVEYKLQRGKWRPKLLDYAKALSAGTVKAATSEALDNGACHSADGDIMQLKEAMEPLMKLKVCVRSTSMLGSVSLNMLHALRFQRGTCRAQGLQPRLWS